MKILNCITTIMFCTTTASITYAGVSSEIRSSEWDVPCDNVEYPVQVSVNAYTENAGPTIQLNRGVKNALIAANTRTTTNTVTDSYTHRTNFSFGFEPKFVESTAKGSIGYEFTYARQISDSDAVSFAQSQQISIMPNIDYMTATPVFFKKQIWGGYYKCDSNTQRVERIHAHNTLQLDVVTSQGWVLNCPQNPYGTCSSPNDFISN